MCKRSQSVRTLRMKGMLAPLNFKRKVIHFIENDVIICNQMWEHTPKRTLRHRQSGLCLDSKDVKSGQHVTVDNCDIDNYSQIWQFSLNMNN